MTAALAEWRRGRDSGGPPALRGNAATPSGRRAGRGFEHAAAMDVQLFSMSDVPLMRFSRFYRFEAD
jgi:hypothetical protein